MSQQRANRVRELMKVEISDILRHDLRDPRIGELTTVTDVELTSDLRHAKVFVSVYGDSAKQEQTLKGLVSAIGFIRTEISKRISLRVAPEISFTLDQSIAQGARIFELLNQVKSETDTPIPDEIGKKQDE